MSISDIIVGGAILALVCTLFGMWLSYIVNNMPIIRNTPRSIRTYTTLPGNSYGKYL